MNRSANCITTSRGSSAWGEQVAPALYFNVDCGIQKSTGIPKITPKDVGRNMELGCTRPLRGEAAPASKSPHVDSGVLAQRSGTTMLPAQRRFPVHGSASVRDHTFVPAPEVFVMNSDYLRLLLGFHYWARDRVMAAVEALTPEQYARPLGSSFSSIRGHAQPHLQRGVDLVFQVEWRIAHELPEGRDAGSPNAARQVVEMEGNVRAYIDTAGDSGLDRVIEYRLMSGKEGASPLWQMVAHVVNHASYHRGPSDHDAPATRRRSRRRART
jgi:uncharacterized damage-inducible protein DinB